jgi:hypothetical protein
MKQRHWVTGPRFLKMRPLLCLETPGTDNPVARRHIPEEREPHTCNSFLILSFLILPTTVHRSTTLQVAFLQTVSVNDPHVNQPPAGAPQ